MTEPLSKRRLAENQVIFRRRNEKVAKGLESLKQAAKSEGHDTIAQNIEQNMNEPLHFYCECSDDNCHKRIVLKPSEYTQLHQNKSQFIILPGHEVPSIERVRQTSPNYVVVEKYQVPPPAGDELNPTDVNNS